LQLKDKNVLYPVAQIFVNLTNSYAKKEVEPELLELAKFSKQHVPEEHEKVSSWKML
jgi:protein unc-45